MNYLAILVSAVVSMIIGFIWYGPLFKKAWIKISGCDPETMTPEQKADMKKSMVPMMITQFILSVLSIFVLAKFGGNMEVAFWAWLGFVMPITASGVMWSGKPKKLAWSMFWISAGCQLVTFLAYGIILNAFK